MATVLPTEPVPVAPVPSTAQATIARGRGGRGRGRGGRGRGRGNSRGRGRGTHARGQHRDPTQGWRVTNVTGERLLLEDVFVEKVIGERARVFCTSAMERLEVERLVRQLGTTRADYLVLFVDELLHTCLGWLNEYIVLHRRDMQPLKIYDLYRYVSILLLSHCTGFSFQKTIDILQKDGCPTPLDKVRFISNNMLAFSPTGRGRDGGISWLAQRDQTPRLTQFEITAFRVTCKIFVCPSHTFATLDDLYGTRAADNQVKTLSNRKADKEGHTADAIADALFRITLMVRFRRRGISQTDNVYSLVEAILEGRGEQSVHGFILTADRGYGKLSLMRELLCHRIGSIMIMPEHLLQSHPFVGKSFLSITRNDDEDKSESESSDTEGEDGRETQNGSVSLGNSNPAIALTGCSSTPNSVELLPESSVLDRPRSFVINDGPDEGPASWWAVKNLKAPGRRAGVPDSSAKVTAVALREKGSDKFSKVIRFMYCVPSTLSKSLETWIAVPRNSTLSNKLFQKRNDDGKFMIPAVECTDMRDVIERHILNHCAVLTVDQRCADWFVLRQFRVTGTSAGKILCANANIRGLVGMADRDARNEQSFKEHLSSFAQTWFSSSRSTEPMMRGTANEGAVMSSLNGRDFVKCIYECGMLGKKNETWLACSPDGIAIIDLSLLGMARDGVLDGQLAIASVEIKTSTAQSTLDRALSRATAEVVKCSVGDAKFKQYIPTEHIGQVLHQLVVLSVNYLIYISASEAGVMYTVVVHCSSNIIDQCCNVLTSVALPTVSWAHEQNPKPPAFTEPSTARTLKSRLPFWMMVNNYVKDNDALPPLKTFRHASQSLYSKTKGGVDGSAQARAILRSSTSSLKWEQKVVSQTIKTLAINAFIAWRMDQKKELLETKETFQSLNFYRRSLNEVESLADFTYEVSRELLNYAKSLETSEIVETPNDDVVSDQDLQRLCSLAARRKRKRLLFFNGADGVKLRLSAGHVMKQQKQQQYCALCGVKGCIGNDEGWRGHRTTYMCVYCDVHLCTRIYTGMRKSCSELWHSTTVLKPRSTPRPSSSIPAQGSGTMVDAAEAATVQVTPQVGRRRGRNESSDAVGPVQQRSRSS